MGLGCIDKHQRDGTGHRHITHSRLTSETETCVRSAAFPASPFTASAKPPTNSAEKAKAFQSGLP